MTRRRIVAFALLLCSFLDSEVKNRDLPTKLAEEHLTKPAVDAILGKWKAKLSE